ncbi:MAG: putative baseplate assembly protein, partial [Egibacteraceae bacterium]
PAHTIGGTVEAAHAEAITGEVIGQSEGVPDQCLPLKRRPVVPSDTPVVLESSIGMGWQEWTAVDHFAESTESDRHFVLDKVAGEVRFGPAVREADGSWRQYGAVPPKGAQLRVRAYRTGGGQGGNVARGAIRVLKTSIPYIARIENRRPASGGVDGETIGNAKLRGPLVLRTGSRAVTAEDYEHLARAAAPEVARIRCLTADSAVNGGFVRVLVVPAASGNELGQLRFDQMVPSDESLARIADYLDERRSIGARVVVQPAVYQGITVVARLRARPRTHAETLQQAALATLYRYFHPIIGGPEGQGWPFGRPVHAGEVYGVLQRLTGVELVEDARLYPADPIMLTRGELVDRLHLEAGALVFSYEHQVQVRQA